MYDGVKTYIILNTYKMELYASLQAKRWLNKIPPQKLCTFIRIVLYHRVAPFPYILYVCQYVKSHIIRAWPHRRPQSFVFSVSEPMLADRGRWNNL